MLRACLIQDVSSYWVCYQLPCLSGRHLLSCFYDLISPVSISCIFFCFHLPYWRVEAQIKYHFPPTPPTTTPPSPFSLTLLCNSRRELALIQTGKLNYKIKHKVCHHRLSLLYLVTILHYSLTQSFEISATRWTKHWQTRPQGWNCIQIISFHTDSSVSQEKKTNFPRKILTPVHQFQKQCFLEMFNHDGIFFILFMLM